MFKKICLIAGLLISMTSVSYATCHFCKPCQHCGGGGGGGGGGGYTPPQPTSEPAGIAVALLGLTGLAIARRLKK